MEKMDIHHLRYFQAVAERGSLTAAARHLGVSQPTLTVAMRKLEARFDTTLLLRNPRGVTVTRTGQELLNHIVQIFAILDDAEQRIHGLEQEEIGDFVVGCHESLGAYFLPGFLNDFIARAPGIQVTLWNSTSRDVYDAVIKRDIHFGLIVNPMPHPDLVMINLFEDAVDLFVTEDDALPPDATLQDALDRLARGPLIFAGRVAQARQLIEQLSSDISLPERLLSCGDLELVKSLTLAGLGVGVIPRRVAAYNTPRPLRRLHPDLPFIPDRIVLAYRADMHRTRGALRLKDELVRYGKAL